MMNFFYSATTGGFHLADADPESIPADAVEVSEEEHAELFRKQSLGHEIVAVEGRPVARIPMPQPVTPEQARAERQRLLNASDWTQVADAPEGVAEKWRGYRQALRDVPSQKGFPDAVKWPKEPT